MTDLHHTMQDRHVVVTGAARGIGAAIATCFYHAGANVTIMGRDLSRLQTCIDRIHREAPAKGQLPTVQRLHAVAVDVANEQSVTQAFDAALTQFGPVHVLVNNAGQAVSEPFVKTEPALWQQMMNVNLTGTYLCTRAALPSMLDAAQQGISGRIINIASTAGLKGYAYVSAYVAAKHGVVGLTRSLALELAKKNITVNAICPGYTETDIVSQAVATIVKKTSQTPEQAWQSLASRNPQKKMVQPDEVAQAALYLCLDASRSINGQSIAIDGGETIE